MATPFPFSRIELCLYSTYLRYFAKNISLVLIIMSMKVLFTFTFTFIRRFYPKRLTVHSGYTYFCQYMCSLGIEPTTFALLTQCSTTEPQEVSCLIVLKLTNTRKFMLETHVSMKVNSWERNIICILDLCGSNVIQ